MTRRECAFGLAIALTAVGLLGLLGLKAANAGDHARRGRPQAGEPAAHGAASWPLAAPTLAPGQCIARPAKAATGPVELSRWSHVTLTLGITCAELPTVLHVVYVLDASDRMALPGHDPDYLGAAKSLISDTIVGMSLPQMVVDRAGIVAFADDVQVVSPLTADESRLITSLATVSGGGGSALDTGIAAARKMLTGAPHELRDPVSVIALAGTAHNASGCAGAVREAEAARRLGIVVGHTCFGACEYDCARRLVSEPRLLEWSTSTSWWTWMDHFDRLRELDWRRPVIVTEAGPDNMLLLQGTANPSPIRDGLLDNVVVWQGDRRDLATITYSLEPLEVGHHPISVASYAVYSDELGASKRIDFPIPWIDVLPYRPPTTATATSAASSTPTRATPTILRPTVVPTGTPSVSPMPTGGPGGATEVRVWLPHAANDRLSRQPERQLRRPR